MRLVYPYMNPTQHSTKCIPIKHKADQTITEGRRGHLFVACNPSMRRCYLDIKESSSNRMPFLYLLY